MRTVGEIVSRLGDLRRNLCTISLVMFMEIVDDFSHSGHRKIVTVNCENPSTIHVVYRNLINNACAKIGTYTNICPHRFHWNVGSSIARNDIRDIDIVYHGHLSITKI